MYGVSIIYSRTILKINCLRFQKKIKIVLLGTHLTFKGTLSLPKFTNCSVRETPKKQNCPFRPNFGKIFLLDRVCLTDLTNARINNLYGNTSLINFQYHSLKYFYIFLWTKKWNHDIIILMTFFNKSMVILYNIIISTSMILWHIKFAPLHRTITRFSPLRVN